MERGVAQLNFVGSHDTARFLTVAGGDRASAALGALLVFTLPGAPCIYSGDEVGMEGGLPPASRGGYPPRERWDLELLELHRGLAALRHAEVALRRGRLRVLHAAGGMLVFAREHDDRMVVVAVNAGDGVARARVESAAGAGPPALTAGAGVVGEAGTAGAPLDVALLARSAVVFTTSS